MKCNKCGSEIQEGNIFCTNCGAKYVENVSKEKEPIKIKLNHFIIGIVILVVIAILIVYFILQKSTEKANLNESRNNLQVETKLEETPKYQVEIGINYERILDNQILQLTFNNETEFRFASGIMYSEGIDTRGTYKIENNIIYLTVNFDSSGADVPYTIQMTILDNGNIEYVTKYEKNLLVKGNSIEVGNNDTENDVTVDNSVNEELETRDRKTFVNNLTEEDKNYIRKGIAENYLKNATILEFLEDKFRIVDEEIIYVVYTLR